MKRYLKAEGIVLTKKNLLNKDKFVTILTLEYGKLRLFAKGVKKITSRRLPHLETGNYIKIDVYRKQDRLYLQESTLISGFYKIKNDPKKQNFLYVFFFVLNKLLPEEQKEEAVFGLTKHFLSTLSEKQFKQQDLNLFLNKLLYKLGYLQQEEPQDKLYQLVQEIINEKLPEVML